MKSALFLTLLLVLSVNVHASDYQRCYNAGNTIEINDCLGNVLQREGTRLNRTYQQVLSKLKESAGPDSDTSAEASAQLMNAQELWLQYREADCGAVYESWRDGSIRGTKYVVCQIEKTTHRRKELVKDWIDAK